MIDNRRHESHFRIELDKTPQSVAPNDARFLSPESYWNSLSLNNPLISFYSRSSIGITRRSFIRDPELLNRKDIDIFGFRSRNPLSKDQNELIIHISRVYCDSLIPESLYGYRFF